MVVNHGVWLSALQALLPPGKAFTRHPDSNMTRFLGVFAALFLAAQLKFEALLEQADPRKATTMLPQWERMLGLPDCCTPAALQLADRQTAAYQRLTEEGGQSLPYFINLAALLGEPNVTVTEFQKMTCNSNCNDALWTEADHFVWRMNIPHPALNVRLMTCNSDCNSALQDYTPSAIECAIVKRKPGHTTVQFAYTA